MTVPEPHDPWGVARLDLKAYLARVGVGAEAPSLAALDTLVAAHVQTFSFDNIDVLLDQHPGVDLDAVQAKFVGRGRGGYCFEQATLMSAALIRLGYSAIRRMGRVGIPEEAARTHLAVEVVLDGASRLVDVGMGATPLASIPMVDGAEVTAYGWTHRVTRVDSPDPAWRLWRRVGGDWEIANSIDDHVVRPVDVQMGHHWTSTGPSSHFRDRLTFGAYAGSTLTGISVDPDGIAITTRRPGEPTEREVVDVDLGLERLDALSGGLTSDEITRIRPVLARLAAAAG